MPEIAHRINLRVKIENFPGGGMPLDPPNLGTSWEFMILPDGLTTFLWP